MGASTRYPGAEQAGDCACPAKSYFESRRGGCVSSGLSGTVDSSPVLDEGYMATFAGTKLLVWMCPAARMCLGARPVFLNDSSLSDGICTNGFDGISCARCMPGTSSAGEKCEECRGGQARMIFPSKERIEQKGTRRCSPTIQLKNGCELQKREDKKAYTTEQRIAKINTSIHYFSHQRKSRKHQKTCGLPYGF